MVKIILVAISVGQKIMYNCQNTAKYPSLPTKTSVDYIAAEGRTYMTITGPTTQCKESFTEMWDSTADPSSKSGKNAKQTAQSVSIFD